MASRFCIATMVISFLSLITVIEGPCPPADLVRPCGCSFTGVDVILGCDGLKRQKDLDRVLHRTSSEHFDRFEIVNSKLIALPARSLETKQFSSLRVTNSSLRTLFYHYPSEKNELETFTLENVSFKIPLESKLFANLKKIKKISIRDVNIPDLGHEFRENVNKSLISIFLKSTNTSILDDYAFANMSALVDVRIEENKIRELKRSMFANSNKLETLLFNDNEIGTLPDDMFTDMPNLRRIGLRNNNITQVSEKVFGQAYKNVIALILEGNPIKCDCSIKWFASRQHRSKYVTGACAEPPHLAGREINDLNMDNFIHCVEKP